MMDLDLKGKKGEAQLEGRVRKLEDQMTILKNQIQNTLLEIQEILATRFYHPSLRPVDEPESETESPDSLPARESNRLAGQAGLGGRPAASQKTAVKKVSLDDVRRSWQAGEDAPSGDGGSGGEDGFNLVAFAELVNWVNTSVARIGSVHTNGAIDDCLAEALLAPQVAEQLRQLVSAASGPNNSAGDDAERIEPDEIMAVAAELRAILSRSSRA